MIPLVAVHRRHEIELAVLGTGVQRGILDAADAGLGDGLTLVADASRLAGRREEAACSASSWVGKVPRLRRLPVFGSTFRQYSR